MEGTAWWQEKSCRLFCDLRGCRGDWLAGGITASESRRRPGKVGMLGFQFDFQHVASLGRLGTDPQIVFFQQFIPPERNDFYFLTGPQQRDFVDFVPQSGLDRFHSASFFRASTAPSGIFPVRSGPTFNSRLPLLETQPISADVIA